MSSFQKFKSLPSSAVRWTLSSFGQWINCRTKGLRVTIPVPRGRIDRPTKDSMTELFPELCKKFHGNSKYLDSKAVKNLKLLVILRRRFEATVLHLNPLYWIHLATCWWQESRTPYWVVFSSLRKKGKDLNQPKISINCQLTLNDGSNSIQINNFCQFLPLKIPNLISLLTFQFFFQ